MSNEEVVKANNAFAVDVYKKLSKDAEDFIFSPLSVNIALRMTYAGARGQTAHEIASALYLAEDKGDVHIGFTRMLQSLINSEVPGCQTRVANAFWGQERYPFSKDFEELLREKYHSSLNIIDLTGWPGYDASKAEAARKAINQWVAQQTEDQIGELVPPSLPDSHSRLLLVNGISFKGVWSTSFNKADTRAQSFQTDSRTVVTVPMMHQKGEFKYSEDERTQVLELSYASNAVSMLIVLPKANDGLKQLDTTLTIDLLEQLWGDLRQQQVTVSLPRFKQRSRFDLTKALRSLGITDAFSPSKADLSGIAQTNGLFIDAALHQACIEVDERGTRAAAATAIGFTDSMPDRFSADHPFFFLIRHNKTGMILFMGRITNPAHQP